MLIFEEESLNRLCERAMGSPKDFSWGHLSKSMEIGPSAHQAYANPALISQFILCTFPSTPTNLLIFGKCET